MWDAQHAPENVGLSHNVLAHTSRQGEQLFVESIEHVQSVDLVADPATTNGLFEHAEKSFPAEQADPIAWEALTLQQLEARRPDLLKRLAEDYQERATGLLLQIDQLEQQLEESRPRTQAKEQSLVGEAAPARTRSAAELVAAIIGRG